METGKSNQTGSSDLPRELSESEVRVLRNAISVNCWEVNPFISETSSATWWAQVIETVRNLLDEGLLAFPAEEIRVEKAFKAEELKDFLKSHGLMLKGNKRDFAQRLLENAREETLEELRFREERTICCVTTEEGLRVLDNHLRRKADRESKFEEELQERLSDLEDLLKSKRFVDALKCGNKMYSDGYLRAAPAWRPNWLEAISKACPSALDGVDRAEIDRLKIVLQLRVFPLPWHHKVEQSLDNSSGVASAAKEIRVIEDCATRVYFATNLRMKNQNTKLVLAREPGESCSDCSRLTGMDPFKEIDLTVFPSSSCRKPDGCYLKVEALEEVMSNDGLRIANSEVSVSSPGARLREAKKLLQDGLISEDSYNEVYEAVLEELKNPRRPPTP
jgi:hypothetical protein